MSALPRSMSRVRFARLRTNVAALRRDPESAAKAAKRAATAPWRTLGFVLLILLVLSLGLVGLLGINTSLAGGSFTVTRLDWQLTRLAEEREALQQTLQTQGSARYVQRRAERLGMVPAPAPAFLDIESGTVKGTLIPAGQSAPRPGKSQQERAAAAQEREAAEQESSGQGVAEQESTGASLGADLDQAAGDGAVVGPPISQFQGDGARAGAGAVDGAGAGQGVDDQPAQSTDDGAVVGGGN